ncbi:MAG: heavy-metal-associated domain-containing protein [Anaerolineales bacterium]
MTEESRSIQLKVVGDRTIHCSGCEDAVKFTLSRMAGLEEIEANHRSQLIQFQLDPALTDLEKVREELEWIGYEVEVI